MDDLGATERATHHAHVARREVNITARTGKRRAAVVTQMMLHELLDRSASARPDAPALSYRASFATYAEVRAATLRLAGALSRLGIARGDRIAVHLANRPEAVELAFAASRIGAVFMPLNPGLRARQLAHVLRTAALAC